MLTGVSPNESWEFSSISDVGENKSVFVLSNIGGAFLCYLKDKHRLIESGKEKINSYQFMLDLVRFSLKEWKNYRDSRGELIPFKKGVRYEFGKDRDVVGEDTLDRLQSLLIVEMANNILEKQELTETERKN